MDLLDLDRLNGTAGGAGRRASAGRCQRPRRPAAPRCSPSPPYGRSGGHTYVFVTDGSGTAAYQLVDAAHPRLRQLWANGSAGTSPVVAGGLLYVFDPGGTINIRRPLSGALVRSLPAGSGHWNSPIVTGGRLIEPTGAYGSNASSSVIDIYHLPGPLSRTATFTAHAGESALASARLASFAASAARRPRIGPAGRPPRRTLSRRPHAQRSSLRIPVSAGRRRCSG